MLTRDGAGRILRARWPPLVALAATLAYAVVVIGFGLDFRPLHNDEGVTLGVASRASAIDVLRVAVDHRHGPPLHYLLVHASLVVALRHPGPAPAVGGARHRRGGDQLRLRARAGGPGRRCGRRRRHRLVADHDPPRPVRARLHRHDRGRVRERVADAGAHPHRDGALGRAVRAHGAAARIRAPVRPLRALLGARADGHLRRSAPAPRPGRAAPAGRRGGGGARARRARAPAPAAPVRAPAEQVRRRLGDVRHQARLAAVLGAVRRLRVRLGARRLRRRAGRRHRCSAWPRLRSATGGRRSSRRCGSCSRCCSSPSSPRRRATSPRSGTCRSCCPGTRWRSPGSRSSCAPVPATGSARWSPPRPSRCCLAPGWVADHNELADFNADLRDASLYMADRFGPDDVLATTAGTLSQAEDPRLVGAYAVLAAPELLSTRVLAARRPGPRLQARPPDRPARRAGGHAVARDVGAPSAAGRPGAADGGSGRARIRLVPGRVGDPAAADGALRAPRRALPVPHGGRGRPVGLRRAPDGAPVPPRRRARGGR